MYSRELGRSQMELTTIGSLALYAFVMSITPGPNNMLLANAGLVFSFRSTIPQIVGIPTGVISQILLVAAGLSSLFAQFPSIQLALKMAGTFYLLWLALKLWTGPVRHSVSWLLPSFSFDSQKSEPSFSSEGSSHKLADDSFPLTAKR